MKKQDLKEVAELLDAKLEPINKTLKQHGKILEEHSNMFLQITQTLVEHGKMLAEHGKMLAEHGKMLVHHSTLLRSLKKDQSLMLKFLDHEQMDQRERLRRVEDHLGLSPIS